MQARSPSVFRPEFVRLLALQPLGGFAICVFYLLPKFLATELHATPSQVGLSSAAFGAASVLAVPIVGFAMKRGSARALIGWASLVLAGSAFAFLGVERMSGWVLVLRGAQGLAWALSFTAGMILTARLAPAARLAEAIGYFGSANLAMNAIAPAIAESTAEAWGWKPVFALAGVAGLAAGALARGLPTIPAATPRDGDDTWTVLRRPSSLRMIAIVVLWGNAFGAMFTFYQPFALSLGIQQVRSFFLAYTALALFSRLGTGNLPDRLGRHTVAVGSLALYGLVVLAMPYLRPGWLGPLGGLFGLAHGLFFPAYSAVSLEDVAIDEQGQVMAVSNAAFNAGYALSGIVFGAVAERHGYRTVFFIAGLTTLAAVALLLVSRTRPLSSRRQPAQRFSQAAGSPRSRSSSPRRSSAEMSSNPPTARPLMKT